MNRLVAIASPSKAAASRLASTNHARSAPVASTIADSMAPSGNFQSGSRVKSAVGVLATLTTTRVWPSLMRASASRPAVTTTSQPSTASAEATPMRGAYSGSPDAAKRTKLITAPFFCASPVTSSTVTPLPSRCAAMPSSWPTVTTPVPPMPVTSRP